MLGSPRKPRFSLRSGAAVVEMALLLPLLVFLCVISVDFARIFYFSQTISNCARNGALYESDAYNRAESPYKSLEEAALADAGNLNDPANPPNVTSSGGVDSTGVPYVEVTVQYKFKTVSRFPGVPSTMLVRRTVRMSQAPSNPKQ
jgi:Flp pilus assembly protein TadG